MQKPAEAGFFKFRYLRRFALVQGHLQSDRASKIASGIAMYGRANPPQEDVSQFYARKQVTS